MEQPGVTLGIATLIVVWGAVPFVALTLFAGLLQIPDDLYEAARVDGAGFWSQLRAITVPLLVPILLLLTTLSVLWDSRVFTQIYFLQQQGGIPGDTNLFGLWAYETSFAGRSTARAPPSRCSAPPSCSSSPLWPYARWSRARRRREGVDR